MCANQQGENAKSISSLPPLFKALITVGVVVIESETPWDAEVLVKNPSVRLLGKKFQDLKKGKNKPFKNETSRLIKNQRLRDPAKFSETHVFRGTTCHPFQLIFCNMEYSDAPLM